MTANEEAAIAASTYSVYERMTGRQLASRKPRKEAIATLNAAKDEGRQAVLVRDYDGKGLEQLDRPAVD